ncbi:DUF4383 domain-containing protein [Geodermatophilus sp. TF02-6]|uniref:DUF4383 domain-containing protein n=1 Tax=Geodermatophilus sp. TF02-6 TaxID=2250575 RepID=UPI000DEBEFD4|nr:DUF4383 domain-containing protein [Geodermatophilus sp. TF02-6]RBY75532.1 DUF4383 domain-containing protein [Geodermatophilus sp. TF02-6]
MAAAADRTTAGRTWPQTLSLVFGVVYLLVGLAGFFVTGGNFFGMDHSHSLLGFHVNGLHNVAHVLVGVLGIVLSRTLAGARTYGWLLGVAYGALFVYGLFAAGESWDVLNINAADNVLHILSAIVGFGIALGPVRGAVTDRSTRV